MKAFTCDVCKTVTTEYPDGQYAGLGYAVNPETNEKICYACCATLDTNQMVKHNKITLYLVKHGDSWFVTNWPGSLSFPVTGISTGKHNIARTQTHVWFRFRGFWWHGVQYGDFSELCYCKRTKQKY